MLRPVGLYVVLTSVKSVCHVINGVNGNRHQTSASLVMKMYTRDSFPDHLVVSATASIALKS
jgi:hypothetical protein